MGCPKLNISNEKPSPFQSVWKLENHQKSGVDVYAFGSLMPGRNFNANSYRYKHQGQESDDEIAGTGNIYNYKYRMSDARLGRFWSIDPLAPQYPGWSPYAYSQNRVIDGIEWEGLEYVSANNTGLSPETIENSQNDDGTYNLTLGDQTFNNVESVNYDGEQYFNLGEHVYYGDEGWNTTGDGSQISEWAYTDIQNFDETTDHTYRWADDQLTGNDHTGSPANTNCAYLAEAQANACGTNLQGGVVSQANALNANGGTVIQLNTAEGIDYINRQLEAGNVVVVGVDYGPGGTDVGTDHYVTITGRTSVNGDGRFLFMENAVGDPQQVRNFNTNRFTPGANNITGNSVYENNMTITRIQRNQ